MQFQDLNLKYCSWTITNDHNKLKCWTYALQVIQVEWYEFQGKWYFHVEMVEEFTANLYYKRTRTVYVYYPEQ